jgi:PAS domain S-box-containing protein
LFEDCAPKRRGSDTKEFELPLASNYSRASADELELDQAREALRDAELRYRAIVDCASDAIISTDERGLVTDFNPAAQAMFGWASAEVIGRDLCQTIIAPAVREEHRRRLASHRDSLQAARPAIRLELSGLHSSGREFPIELTFSRVAGGTLPRFTAVIGDLTARGRTAAQPQLLASHVQASESQYRTLFVDNPQPMCVYDPQSLRFLAVNSAAVAQYGFSEAEFLELTMPDLRPAAARAALTQDLVNRRYRGQQRQHTRHQRKNGELLEVEIFANDIVFRGKPARMVLAIDVTEHRRAALDLRRSEARFRDLTEMSADWFWEQDEDFRFVGIEGSPFPLLVPPYSKILGKTRWELPGAPLQGSWEEHRRALECHEPFREFEVKRMGEDGRTRVLSLSGAPVFDDEGRFSGYRGVGRDITERRRAEQEIERLNAELEERVKQRTAELEAANAELEAFSYSIAHDLRSPLTSIDGFSHTLDELYGKVLGEPGRHYIGRIRAGVQQMSDLTDAMLTLARLSRVKLRFEKVDLAALARATIAQLRDAQPQRNATLEVPNHLYAHGDPRLLAQVVANLVGNAWKFSGKKSDTRITVGSREGETGETVYYVADCGAGFDMAYASRLFGPFQRLHAASEFEGTGIGLALVQKIVLRHGGRIWAESRSGCGATFFFTLAADLASDSTAG